MITFSGEFYQTFKKGITPILYNFFQQTEAKGILLNSFYEASIILTKPDKEIIRKKPSRTTSLMNINGKSFNNILANQIQQYIKRIIYHKHLGFIPGMQDWFNIQKTI